jgi:hypothetical protein
MKPIGRSPLAQLILTIATLPMGLLASASARGDDFEYARNPAPALTLNLNPDRINSLRQSFDDQNRNYQIRESFGVSSYLDEMNHLKDIKDMGRNVFSAVRDTNSTIYEKKLVQSEHDGEISQSLLQGGAVAAIALGAPLRFNFGDQSKATWKNDLTQRRSRVDLDSADLKASVEVNGSASAQEHYQINMSKALAFNLNSSVGYGGSSNTVNASLSRPLFDRVSGSVSAVCPAGASPTGTPAQGTIGFNYGIRF